MRAAAALAYMVIMTAGFYGSGTVDSGLSALLPLGVLASGLVAYSVPWVAPLLPPAALTVALALGSATEAFDNEYGALNFAGGLLLVLSGG